MRERQERAGSVCETRFLSFSTHDFTEIRGAKGCVGQCSGKVREAARKEEACRNQRQVFQRVTQSFLEFGQKLLL